MRYKIYDKVNKEYLDLTKYCVNGLGDIMTVKGDIIPNNNDFDIVVESDGNENILNKLIDMSLSAKEIQRTYERYKWNIDYFSQQNKELLQALKDLWGVRSTPFTGQQTNHKLEIECKVEEIIRKYDFK